MITIVLPRGIERANSMITCSTTGRVLVVSVLAQDKRYTWKQSQRAHTLSTVATVGPELGHSSTFSDSRYARSEHASWEVLSSLSESYMATIRASIRFTFFTNSCKVSPSAGSTGAKQRILSTSPKLRRHLGRPGPSVRTDKSYRTRSYQDDD
jgi:hypothetical protein